ncbi:MAG TPA: MmcQ/YjbR family DNA-binding protein [Kofleriaceae bacterium]|nr:MmcQ/YjbR family DNA-binding protein [Kofleriaceae bacterium]
MASKATAADAAADELRAFGLAYPGTHRKSPWPGHDDLAVNDKTFAYLSARGEPFSIGCKLPASAEVALLLPFCEPTPYGLGKSGWVTAKPPPGKTIPVEMFKEWIDESYRAQAPKKLLKELDGMPAPKTKGKPAAKPKPKAKKKPAKKRA